MNAGDRSALCLQIRIIPGVNFVIFHSFYIMVLRVDDFFKSLNKSDIYFIVYLLKQLSKIKPNLIHIKNLTNDYL
jgi:hypothetical protein